MRRKVKQMMRLLHKTPHDPRQTSCPEFRASAVVSPLNHSMKPRDELAGNLPYTMKDPRLILAPLSILKSRYGIYLSPRLNKEESMERYQDAKHLAERIIELFGLDVVYVARMDSDLIEPDRSDAFATVLVAYAARGAEMPHWIPAAMYQRPNQGAEWRYNPEELPQEFESGYSRLFGREKVQYAFTCLAKYRVQYSDGELKTFLKHAERLEHAVTSH